MLVVETATAILAMSHPNRATVFTMGALHSGHVALINEARSVVGETGQVVVSIFVNPTQFNDPKDFAKYPNTLDADLAICESAKVDVVFVPSVSEIYPGDIPQYSVAELGDDLEGASRPGHFDAVATVVARLLDLTKPAHTFFGEKDYQQLVVVQRLVAELGLDVQVHAVPTVRTETGLALSSRNQRLSEAGRETAAQISAALRLVASQLVAGESVSVAQQNGVAMLRQTPNLELDYLEIRTADLQPASETGNPLRILVAAMVEGVRLIDNVEVVRG